jgi:hypothetical protein
MKSPAKMSQGFLMHHTRWLHEWPFEVARAGLNLPASGINVWMGHRYVRLPAEYATACATAHVTALHSCNAPIFRDTLAPAIRSGITPELKYEVGNQSFASGTPATGARTTADIRPATGSKSVGSKIAPNRISESEFSTRLSRGIVKGHLKRILSELAGD